jgi:hypothetical protein
MENGLSVALQHILPYSSDWKSRFAHQPDGGPNMFASQVITQGTLAADGTLNLDEKLHLPPGRVRVIVQALGEQANKPDWWEVAQQAWKENEARGFQPRTKEQIDADLNALRDGWEERMKELEAIHEEARRSRVESSG